MRSQLFLVASHLLSECETKLLWQISDTSGLPIECQAQVVIGGGIYKITLNYPDGRCSRISESTRYRRDLGRSLRLVIRVGFHHWRPLCRNDYLHLHGGIYKTALAHVML
jgi:hypothetical protein